MLQSLLVPGEAAEAKQRPAIRENTIAAASSGARDGEPGGAEASHLSIRLRGRPLTVEQLLGKHLHLETSTRAKVAGRPSTSFSGYLEAQNSRIAFDSSVKRTMSTPVVNHLFGFA